jgi:acetyltransferase-like isoleucine patch superfamily enzyme
LDRVRAGVKTRLQHIYARARLAAAIRMGRLSKLMGREPFRRRLGPAGRRAAWRALGAQIDESARIGPGVWMRRPAKVTIGANCKLGGRVVLEGYGELTIGRNTIINTSELFTSQHEIDDPEFKGQQLFITIGEYVWLPRKVIVLPGVTIGDYAVVGTGSVVSSDVPEYAVVAGNPARVIKERARVDYNYDPADISRSANGGEVADLRPLMGFLKRSSKSSAR